ncbi:MAG: hypothetical protein AB4206_20370 [Xenococcaceae cyanobacterium]
MNKRLFVGLLLAVSLIATPAYSEPASPESIRMPIAPLHKFQVLYLNWIGYYYLFAGLKP